MLAVEFILICLMVVTLTECQNTKTVRGLKDKINSKTKGDSQPEFSCQSICSGMYDLCLQMTKTMNEQMLCLRLKLICAGKCPKRFIVR